MSFVKNIVKGLLGMGDNGMGEYLDSLNQQTAAMNKQALEIQKQIAEMSKQNADIAKANEASRQATLEQQAKIQRQNEIAAENARVRQENLQALETANAEGDQFAAVEPGGQAAQVEESDPKKKKKLAINLSSTLGIK